MVTCAAPGCNLYRKENPQNYTFHISPPDGLLTSGSPKHDVEGKPHTVAPDPFASDDCLDVFSPVYQFLPPEPEELNTMNPSEDEPSSGLNGRLRPRKSAIPIPQSNKQIVRKLDCKHAQEKPKRSSTPSKASPSKPDDLSSKSSLLPTPQLLCPYCDKIFVSKQSVSKHVRRLHLSNSNLGTPNVCLFCNHVEPEPSDIIRHMVDSHPNQYFACLDCHTRFPSTKELAEHKLNICEKQKIPYRSKLRQKTTKKNQKSLESSSKDYNVKNFSEHGFNGIVISCELKPSHVHDEADIEDNITTNLILPPSKNITTAGAVLEKNAVIVLDDLQWNRRIPSNFSFHNADADQILSRLGVVHRSPKTGESTKKDWFRVIEDATQKFEKCFDTSFYSKVASNVQENLTKFLEGSFNFNPDPDSTIKTRKSKNSVVINTAEGFPILLACEQFSRNVFDGYMPRAIAPKHKWKWDSLENEKHWNPDQIKKDTHANNCIITLVSSLDIWTQLCMRRKYEEKYNITPVEKNTLKKNVIGKELKEILESRDIPSTNTQIVKHINPPVPISKELDFPTSLGLMPSNLPNFNVEPAILSGEWVRPRCYVCCACGEQSRDSRALNMHVSSQHPNAQVQHYEIVGESLLKADILKHLYVPPSQNINRTRPPRGFRDCTKCKKSVTNDDLHQHMLDCAGDTPAVRRKCRYRPFGVRRRRPRLPDNRIRKKIHNDIRTRPSRQKTRMRSKPKIRSEVGDAETIRKMLADLPAKRHRVLVNPLNSILRPRRKLDKQRTMLMMKRRTTEDPKGSKPRPSNSSFNYDHSANSNRCKNATNKDDDDNKPLKRLKRVPCKITRQKEALNRKSMLNKPKRKLRSIVEKKNNEGNETVIDNSTSCPEKIPINQLSMDHNGKRINLNNDQENVREHSSGRGSNGWRDNQQPGCSGDNENSRNICAPAQNVPLKHSIARLTANSETHDKSVQFHHLFLVQQECNNTNEHVPSGQRVLFENEAVVTKLDKPPLHFNQNTTLEAIQTHSSESVQNIESVPGQTLESIQGQTLESIQKNKLNKPRKGLNDCIAMLKNKLVDVEPNAPGHVSVQCGTDDILTHIPDPVIPQTSVLQGERIEVSTKCVQQANYCKERTKKSSPKSKEQTGQSHSSETQFQERRINHESHDKRNIEKKITQWRPVNYDAIMPKYTDSFTRKETSRHRSLSQNENLLLAQQLLSVPPHRHDILMRLSAEAYDSYNLPSQKNVRPRQRSSKPVVLQNLSDRTITDMEIITRPPKRSLEVCDRNTNIHSVIKKSVNTSYKKTKSRYDASRQSIDSLEKTLTIRKDVPKSITECTEKYRMKSIERQTQRDPTVKITKQGTTAKNFQVIRKQKPSNLISSVNLTQYPQLDQQQQSKSDVNIKMPISAYPENSFSDTIGAIPFAHASTHVESILSAPLDLSGKASTIDSSYSTRHDSLVIPNYAEYETLDLSKKSTITLDQLPNEDVVVDLRVKHNSQDSGLPCLKIDSSQQDMGMVSSSNLAQPNVCVPTDLSLKKKDDICINLSRNENAEHQIQDLYKNNPTDNADYVLNVQASLPTDLSNKMASNLAYPQISEEGLTKNKHSNCQLNYEKSDNLNRKVNEDKSDTVSSVTDMSIADNVTVPDKSNPKEVEHVNENMTEDSSLLSVSETNGSQLQKPIYDPTLRIPQFKIRSPGSNLNSQASNTSEERCLEATTISIENFSSPQEVLINCTNSSLRTSITTMLSSPRIACIEGHERNSYSCTNAVMSASVTVAGSLPVYTLMNPRLPMVVTTFESTRPVYALPTACISMTNVAKTTSLTDNLLSIPSTTVMSTTPVYTLAGTTMVTPLNYVPFTNSGSSLSLSCGAYLPEIDNQSIHHTSRSVYTQELRTHDDNMLFRSNVFSFERDLEITRKIVTLPKEIIAILRTMPIDHRNQLLDVLSQYMAASRPIPILSAQTPLFKHSGHSVASMLTMPIRLSRELAVDASTDTVDIKPLYKQNAEDYCRQLYNMKLNTLSPTPSSSAKLDLCNQVIDLTDDEIVPKIDTDSLTDDPQNKISAPETSIIAPKTNVAKPSNDKTASLRAVRIKAPSERQKSKLVMNQTQNSSSLDNSSVPGNEINDNESIRTLEITNIQLSEISSTQSNRNRLVGSQLPMTVTSSNIIPVQSTPKDSTTSAIKIAVEEHSGENHSKVSEPPVSLSVEIENAIVVATEEKIENNSKNSVNIFQSNLDEINNYPMTVPTNQEKSLTALKLCQDADGDDSSEDDISLAIIVKHKLQNQNKLKSASTSNSETNLQKTKSKQRNKRTSKQNKKQSNSETSGKMESSKVIFEETAKVNVITNTNNTNVANEPSTNIDNLISETVKVAKKGQLKKKAKKNCTESLKTEQIISEKIQKNECESNLNKENDEVIETSIRSKNKEPSASISNEREYNPVHSITGLPSKNINVQEITEVMVHNNTATKIKTTQVSENNELNYKTINKLDKVERNDLLNEFEGNELRAVNKYNVTDSSSNLDDALNTENSDPHKNDVPIKTNLLLNDEADAQKPCSQEKSKNVMKDPENKNDTANNIECAVDNEKNYESMNDTGKNLEYTIDKEIIGLPLRRSRRGKSLFIDGTEEDALNQTVNFSEQKAPLTKKQLIFSKLLLDEKKYLQTKSIPTYNTEMVPKQSTPLPDLINDSPMEICLSKSTCIEGKIKSVKRKSSSLPKKKYKKKKSLDGIQILADESDEGIQVTPKKSSYRDFEANDADYSESQANQNSNVICEKFINTTSVDNFQTKSVDENKELRNKVHDNKIFESAYPTKRKIELTNTSDSSVLDSHNSESKKLKLDTMTTISRTRKENTNVFKNKKNTDHILPLAARRTRSKSVVVKSSGSMLYDPYDIELEDMADITEPFRKQRLSLHNTKSSRESNLDICADNESVTKVVPEMISNVCEANTSTNSKENVSDSDESTKSDVPLKKYAERKNSQLIEKSNSKTCSIIEVQSDTYSPEIKQKRKNQKKGKIIPAADNLEKPTKDTQNESEKQLRSEQFMESFGFFSERKPRKSNLLATKKISETFHLIANESDDTYMESKERSSKKTSRSEQRKEENSIKGQESKYAYSAKLSPTLSLKDKLDTVTRYCHVCKKEFRRSDNLVRHQMTLLHVSNLSEMELKFRTTPVPDDPNYLVVYKEHLDKLKILEDKMKSKKKSRQKFTFPSVQKILADVHRTVREQQLARRSLSRDEALFLDCCELLKEPNGGQIGTRNINRPIISCCAKSYGLACISANEIQELLNSIRIDLSDNRSGPSTSGLPKKPVIHTSARLSGMADFVLVSKSKQSSTADSCAQPSTSTAEPAYSFDRFAKNYPEPRDGNVDENNDSKSDGDVDSITAQNILDSEEVRNLENDLLSGLKEAACKFKPLISEDMRNYTNSHDDLTNNASEPYNAQKHEGKSFEKEVAPKAKTSQEIKEMKNLDIIESIDIFEDKFDKIKRKCRSQAAAAKQVQPVVEPIVSHKARKKSDKKKAKKNSKKYNKNTVLTKGALKGYDSIKVSILTSDINMAAIVPGINNNSKRKKKSSSKKKRDKKIERLTHKCDSNGSKETNQKNVDVYEFMDNEEPEIFGLRPSTVMERFKNVHNKDFQSSSKIDPIPVEIESSDSASDEDDFVYMSDDYVCSDDETENSLMSCELGNVKGNNDIKKSISPLKRKDVAEKNAVMGKIFKHNAVRSEKKNLKPKEPTKTPTADLDQLFDSLLEDEPNSSMLADDGESPKRDNYTAQKKRVFSPIELSKYDLKTTNNNEVASKKIRTLSPTLSSDSAVSRRVSSFSSRQSSPRRLSPTRYKTASPIDYGPSTSRRYDDSRKYDKPSKYYGYSPQRKYDTTSDKKYGTSSSRNVLDLSPKSDESQFDAYPKFKTSDDKSSSRKKEKTSGFEHGFDINVDYYDQDALSDDAGVARQRARRKCTVGKQNILAETWSSESEPDGVPPRPNSAESVVLSVSRKRKGRKREGQICGGRKNSKQGSVKKQDIESRVTSNNRSIRASASGGGASTSGGGSVAGRGGAAYSQLSLPGPSGVGPRARASSFWAGDEEPEHVQQHGWIVGDSHKKLVTMLAHAKGRKRNNDDKRHLME